MATCLARMTHSLCHRPRTNKLVSRVHRHCERRCAAYCWPVSPFLVSWCMFPDNAVIAYNCNRWWGSLDWAWWWFERMCLLDSAKTVWFVNTSLTMSRQLFGDSTGWTPEYLFAAHLSFNSVQSCDRFQISCLTVCLKTVRLCAPYSQNNASSAIVSRFGYRIHLKPQRQAR